MDRLRLRHERVDQLQLVALRVLRGALVRHLQAPLLVGAKRLVERDLRAVDEVDVRQMIYLERSRKGMS